MKYLLLILSAGAGIYLALRSKVATSVVDNVALSTGVADDIASQGSSSDKNIAQRNNNPMNIRETDDNWLGLATPRAKDGFFNFVDDKYCYRAAKRIILTSYANRGIKTIKQVISAWAPSNENNTAEYIAYVTDKMGVSPSTIVTTENLDDLCYYMTIVEQGSAESYLTINAGFML